MHDRETSPVTLLWFNIPFWIRYYYSNSENAGIVMQIKKYQDAFN